MIKVLFDSGGVLLRPELDAPDLPPLSRCFFRGFYPRVELRGKRSRTFSSYAI